MEGIKSRNGIPGVAAVDLPREKLERLGPEALKDEELLAILLRTGYEGRNVMEVAREISQMHPPELLMGMDMEALVAIKGIGRVKAASLIAGFEFCRRGLKQGIGIAPSISRPVEAVGHLADIKDRRKEHFVALFLNARNQLICREEVSVGSLNASLVQARLAGSTTL